MKKIAVIIVGLAMMLPFASCSDSDKSARHNSDRIESEDNSKADEIAEIYVETWCGNTVGETNMQLTYPDEYIKKLKNREHLLSSDEYGVAINNEYEYYVATFNSYRKSHNADDWEVVSVKRKDKLTKKECRQAESFFEKNMMFH